MPEVQDQAPVEHAPVEDAPYRWVVRGIYAALIGANLWIAFDWWRDTEQGRSVILRTKAWAADCPGCAKRKAMLQRATARMHREASQVLLLGDDAFDGGAEVPEPPS